MLVDHPRLDFLELDLGARDGQVERLGLVPLQRQRHVAAGLATDPADLVLHGRSVHRLAVDRQHDIARLDTRGLRRRVGERREDDEAAGLAELGTGRQVGGILDVADRHLGADAAECSGQVAERLLVLLRRHVPRVGILDAVLEHAADGTLRQLLGVEVVHVLLLQPLVRLAERAERFVRRRAAGAAARAGRQVAPGKQEGTDHGGQCKGDDPRHGPATARRGRRSGGLEWHGVRHWPTESSNAGAISRLTLHYVSETPGA